jgi:hypothetical protein
VLASSGAGPLQKDIQEYALGIWVAPDSETEILDGATFFSNNLWSRSNVFTNASAINEKNSSWIVCDYKSGSGIHHQKNWNDYQNDKSWIINSDCIIKSFNK